MSPGRPRRVWRLIGRVYGEDSLANVVARGTTWSFGLNLCGLALSVVLQVVLARVLGAGGYGTYAYLLAWMNIALVFVKFDFDLCGVKYVSTYSSAEEWRLLKGFLQTALGLPGLVSIVVAASVALGIWLAQDRIEDRLLAPALLTCLILPFMTLTTVLGAALEGRKLIAQAQIQAVLRPLLKLLLVGLLILVLGLELDTLGALSVNWVSAVVSVGLCWYFLRGASARLKGVTAEYRLGEWLRTAAGLLPASLAQLTLGHTVDVVIVGTIVGTELAGVYGIAAFMLMPPSLVILASGSIARPIIADLFARGEKRDLQKIVLLVGRINIAGALPMVLGLYLLGPTILSWMGSGYRVGYPVLAILSVGLLSATLGGQAAIVLTMTGFQRHASAIIGTSAVANIGLALLLAPRFGLVGVASATATATVLRNILMIGAARRLLGVRFGPL